MQSNKFLLLLLFSIPVFSQQINLTGIVKNNLNAPISNAIVSLIGQGLMDTSGLDGKYEIKSNLPIMNFLHQRDKEYFIIKNGILIFSLTKKENILIEIYNIRGQKIFVIPQKLLSIGSYSVPLPPHPACITFLKIKTESIEKHIKLLPFFTKQHLFFNIESGLNNYSFTKSLAAIDTIQAKATGYVTGKIAVDSYIGSYDITLSPVNINPQIAFKEMFCAYDTLDYPNIFKKIPANRGDTVLFNVRLENIGGANALSVSCSLSTNDPFLTIVMPKAGYNNIASQSDTLNLTPYKVVVSSSIPQARSILFQLFIKDSWGGSWRDSCQYIFNPFFIDAQNIDDDSIPDSHGNGNHIVDIGEAIEYTPRLQNLSVTNIVNVDAVLLPKSSFITVRSSDHVWHYGDFSSQIKLLPAWDYVFDVSSLPSQSSTLALFDLFIYGDLQGKRRHWIIPFSLPANIKIPFVNQLVSSASFGPRASQSSVIFNDSIFLIAGFKNGISSKDIWCSADGLSWTTRTSSPSFSTRANHSSVTFNGKLWLIGGSDSIGALKNDVWNSTDGVNWSLVTPSAGFAPRAYHSSVVFNNKIWVIGGQGLNSVFYNDVWYSSDGNNWFLSTDSAGFSDRASFNATVFQNKIWVIGGGALDVSSVKNDVWYSSDGTLWKCSSQSAPFSPRGYHCCTSTVDRLWVIGGYYNSQALRDIWFTPDGNNWSQLPSPGLFQNRFDFSTAVRNDSLFIIGGRNTWFSSLSDLWVLYIK